LGGRHADFSQKILWEADTVSFHILNSTENSQFELIVSPAMSGRFFVPTTYLSLDTFQWIQERDGIPSKTLYDCYGLKQMFRGSMMPTFDAVVDARFEIVDSMLVSKDGRPIPTDSCGVSRLKLAVSGWCVDPTSGSHHCLFKIKVEVRLHLVFMLCKLRRLLEAGQPLSGWESE
jgi:hypothetical protein